MWFDAQAELAKLAGGRGNDAHPPATLATSATSRASVAIVAIVADVAAPPATTATSATPAQRIASRVVTPNAFPHGLAINGNPLTWTGRIVSLDEWRRLTEWERRGPNGRHWCGIKKQWEYRKETDNG